MKTRFYAIRHCEAVGNREKKFQGTHDGEVSEFGKKQLEYLSLRMRNEHIDYIYSSSRKRAMATAKAVNKFHNLPIQIDDRIAEINAGKWEGKSFLDFPVLFPEEYKLWNETPQDFIAPDGEKMLDVYNRMLNFVKQKAIEHQGKTIVMATHGCALRNLLCWAENKDYSLLSSVVWCSNTAINIIDVDENGVPTLIVENDISHLPDEIKTFSSQKWSEN